MLVQPEPAAATEFVDLEQMREAAKSAIVNPDEYAKASKSSNSELEAYRNAVIDYTTLTDWRGKSDTWAALDGSMRALATYGTSKRKGPATMRRVLAQEGFASERIPNDLIDQAIAAAETLFNAPVPYFEAKPQRAVRLGEFGGAVIPSDASQEVRDILERNGIAYMTYLAGNEEDRQRAVRQMAESPEARGKYFFKRCQARGPARGGYDPSRLKILFGKGADFTTGAHELTHYSSITTPSRRLPARLRRRCSLILTSCSSSWVLLVQRQRSDWRPSTRCRLKPLGR